MTAACFIDTDVLLYAASNAVDDREKRRVARRLLVEPYISFSAQVLQEFYVAAISKKHLQMTHEEAMAVLQSLAAFPVLPVSQGLVMQAIEVKQCYGISYWDAAIITAAKELGCGTVYSEDLNAGQTYDGVQLVNPFITPTPAPSS